MTKMIFVNLPVTDLERAKAFYSALGFVNEPNFSDETAAAMRWSETIVVMLLIHERWKTFTTRPIPDAGSSEVMLAISFDSRAAVDRITDAAAANGGTADVNPVQEHGFMYGRSFLDPDGHIWETFWMDPAAAEASPPELPETQARAS
jgi:predicted lactoylglutathione lyase